MPAPTLIHRYVPGNSPKSPALLLLHGTGGNEDSLIELGEELLPGASLLSPRGAVLEHGMPRFFKRLSEGVFDLEDLRERTAELHGFIQGARERYGLNRIYAVGYSNGANIAANLLLNYNDALQGAVLFRPMLPDTKAPSSALDGLPVLILSGEQDFLVAHDSVRELARLLGLAGAAAEVRWQPAGHQLGLGDVLAASQWFQRHA